jgi:hypothetical protein
LTHLWQVVLELCTGETQLRFTAQQPPPTTEMTVLRSAEAFGRFRLTAEAVSAESCECGDVAERGWLTSWGCLSDEYFDSCWDVRDLADLLGEGYRPEGDGGQLPERLTFDASSDDLLWPGDGWSFLSELDCGEEAIGGSITVHRPGWITDGSWGRVCRLLGWRPLRFA